MVIAILLIPAFAFWIGYRERARKVALIPNSLWRSVSFTSTCIAVFFTWAVFNAFQYFTSLYFERVQGISPIDTSVRFLPMIIVGASTNIVSFEAQASYDSSNGSLTNSTLKADWISCG